MRSTISIMALAALGVGQVMSSPTHAHLHKNAHQKKDAPGLVNVDWSAINWSKLNVDWSKVDYSGGQSGASVANAPPASTVAPVVNAAVAAPTSAPTQAPPATTASSAAATGSSAASASSSASSGGGSSVAGLFNNLVGGVVGVSNSRTSFGGRTANTGNYIDATGNVGTPYGSNVMLVPSVGPYLYTITFVNTSPNSMTINVWNKQGSDGQLNSGCTDAPKKTTLTFNLAPGAQAIVAADEGSILGAAQATTNLNPQSGAFMTNWLEFKFVDHDCGYDVSKIMNGGHDSQVSISAQECSCVSSNTQNNWITETQTTGSGSCYINVGGAHLTAQMGGPL